MRVVVFGADPVGIVAVGANATGIVAIGQLATGVIAIGQLARGAVVVGQLGLGLVAIGQLAVGVVWSAGMAGIGATSGPGLILGLFGRLYALRLLGRRTGPPMDPRARRRGRLVLAVAVTLALATVWWGAAGRSLVDALTRPGGVLVPAPHVLR